MDQPGRLGRGMGCEFPWQPMLWAEKAQDIGPVSLTPPSFLEKADSLWIAKQRAPEADDTRQSGAWLWCVTAWSPSILSPGMASPSPGLASGHPGRHPTSGITPHRSLLSPWSEVSASLSPPPSPAGSSGWQCSPSGGLSLGRDNISVKDLTGTLGDHRKWAGAGDNLNLV